MHQLSCSCSNWSKTPKGACPVPFVPLSWAPRATSSPPPQVLIMCQALFHWCLRVFETIVLQCQWALLLVYLGDESVGHTYPFQYFYDQGLLDSFHHSHGSHHGDHLGTFKNTNAWVPPQNLWAWGPQHHCFENLEVILMCSQGGILAHKAHWP